MTNIEEVRFFWGTCFHKNARARGARGLKLWNVEETHIEPCKKIEPIRYSETIVKSK